MSRNQKGRSLSELAEKQLRQQGRKAMRQRAEEMNGLTWKQHIRLLRDPSGPEWLLAKLATGL